MDNSEKLYSQPIAPRHLIMRELPLFPAQFQPHPTRQKFGIGSSSPAKENRPAFVGLFSFVQSKRAGG